jgi:hypothetical protein
MRVTLLVVASVVLGLLLGSGGAIAHVFSYWSIVDSYHIYSTVTHSTVNEPGGFPDFSYGEDHDGWADNDYPSATHFKLYDTGYYNGWSDDPNHVIFGVAYTEDEYLNNAVADFSWYCAEVDGMDEVRSLEETWDYNGLNSTNNYVIWIQYVYKIDAFCFEIDDHFEHYSQWKAQ